MVEKIDENLGMDVFLQKKKIVGEELQNFLNVWKKSHLIDKFHETKLYATNKFHGSFHP